jgi:hypothetical protein
VQASFNSGFTVRERSSCAEQKIDNKAGFDRQPNAVLKQALFTWQHFQESKDALQFFLSFFLRPLFLSFFHEVSNPVEQLLLNS